MCILVRFQFVAASFQKEELKNMTGPLNADRQVQKSVWQRKG